MGAPERWSPARSDRPAPPAPPVYRVRSATGGTPPGVHLANPRQSRSSAHGRPRSASTSVLRYVGTTVGVFLLALLLVTGVEVVVGQPLSGGSAGQTTLGEILHPGAAFTSSP